ncbi:MAG: hypothetical protein LBH82_02310, partial [Bacteroidales bacterium]|jgi:hypothetical protein|nr:hypothetical protein [Bacteroidales bacterium]
MDTNLKAVGYLYNGTNYTKELQRVLRGIYACYTMMLKDNVELPNDENGIRNNLVLRYLKNDTIREQTGLSGNFIFDREVPEDNTTGRTDIKVQTIQTFIKSEAYYIIECKRLDSKYLTGTSGLNAEYINNGIYRFVSKYYSNYYRVNAMLGFVVAKMDIPANAININTLLKNPKLNNCNTIQEIQPETFIPDCEFHYSSKHRDIDNENFTLYHLMLNFFDNMG